LDKTERTGPSGHVSKDRTEATEELGTRLLGQDSWTGQLEQAGTVWKSYPNFREVAKVDLISVLLLKKIQSDRHKQK
jgi:hypothetical protein